MSGEAYIEGNTLVLGDPSYLEHHGIKGQRWGVRRFQNKDGTRTALSKRRDFKQTVSKVVGDLSNSPQPFVRRPFNKDKIRQRGLITQAEADQCAGLAAGVFKQASQVEPQITGDVIDVVSSTSAKMYGLNNRLKQPTSIAAKIGADAKADGLTFEQAAGGLKDVIRYTAVSDSRDYVDTYNAIKRRLEEKGYIEVKCKNYFQKYQNGEVMHKAVQSTFKNPDGVEFEFQFQTPESQAAKELKVPIYNERRKAGNTSERNAELEQEMRNLAEQVPDPEGVFGIESHSGTKNMKHSSLGAMYDRQLKHTSIGGTMYIEGNALVLGDSSYLEHHGILGQKWGIRRFQNKDGSRTAEGKKRYKTIQKEPDYAEKEQRAYDDASKRVFDAVAKADQALQDRFKETDLGKKNPNAIPHIDGYTTGDISSLFSKSIEKQIYDWIRKQDDLREPIREAEEIRSKAESKLRKKVAKVEHTSMRENTNYIYGNTLVLGDPLYLEHHGIKGQRWGVRRFQNKDGSLTNAGRKRLGYSTKDVKTALVKGGKAVGGAAVTIGKAGYNFGKKAAAAGKAHSEKKKAEKLEKKKEKAAKTRLGVVRNADLFTAAEMAELNKKFKAKDEMTLASLQKGADYCRLAAGMIGSVASINKDFESMTGKSLIPNPVKKEKDKREAAERAEDRARKLAKEDAEEDRKRRADERKSRADDIDFKNKSEDLKNKQSEELRKQAAEARAQAKQTWDEDFAKEKTRAMKGTADENEAKAAVKKQELKTNEIAQREEAVAKREAAADESEERINYARKEVLKRIDDADTYRDALRKATDMLRNAHDLTREQQDEVWAFIKKAQEDKLGHDGMNELYLEHHGIKGQRWGVRRYRNEDGTLTDKGRKHYQKKLDIEKRKLTNADAFRGYYERRRTPGAVLFGVVGAISGGLIGSAVGPAGIAAGAAIVGSISAGTKYGVDTASGIIAGLGANRSKKKIAKYENMLKQDGFIVEDGTLYLEHFGIKNMKWGVRRFQNKDGSLTEAGRKRYGSGNDDEELSGGGGGGGAPEEDEEMKKKIEEAAKKAGMTVDEYRKKMGSKLYDLFGGKYKKEAEDLRKRQLESSKNARLLEKEGGKKNEDADSERVNAKVYGHYAKEANKSYEKSIAGRYDKLKATMAERGKAKKKEAGEKKRKGRTDQYIAGPEQNKNTKHLLDTEYSKSLRRGAERKSRDAAIFGKAADELKRKQASALGKGLKAKADYYGKQVDFIEKTSSEKIMGRRDWKGNLRDSEPYTSVRDSKRAYDKTAQGKLDKARYAVQRTKQRVKNTLEARGSSQIPTKNSSPDQSPTNRPVSREKTKRAVKGSIKVGERRHRSTTSQQGIKQGEKHEGLRTHTLPKMKSLTATAKPMRKLTSKELLKIRSEAKKRRK